jgi:transcription elongation GreA/GreB family factor
MKKEIKLKLYKQCLDYVKNHIEINIEAVSQAQEAVNSEDKNSAGDKYETGRAMMQRETESFSRRLNEAMLQHQLLQSIDLSGEYKVVKPGALVYTTIGIFFIAISVDEIQIDDEEYCIVSAESPISQAMANCSAGSSFSFRGKSVKILEIH